MIGVVASLDTAEEAGSRRVVSGRDDAGGRAVLR